jgi:hypothetical protein
MTVASPPAGNSANGLRRKLHGREFYQSIGSPKVILAPMVDQSEFVRNHCSVNVAMAMLTI